MKIFLKNFFVLFFVSALLPDFALGVSNEGLLSQLGNKFCKNGKIQYSCDRLQEGKEPLFCDTYNKNIDYELLGHLNGLYTTACQDSTGTMLSNATIFVFPSIAGVHETQGIVCKSGYSNPSAGAYNKYKCIKGAAPSELAPSDEPAKDPCGFTEEDKNNIDMHLALIDMGKVEIGESLEYSPKYECDSRFSAKLSTWKSNCVTRAGGEAKPCTADNPGEKAFCCIEKPSEQKSTTDTTPQKTSTKNATPSAPESNQVYKKQGPFTKALKKCDTGSFMVYKDYSGQSKQQNEAELQEWQNACTSLANCRRASEMTWKVAQGDKIDTYTCVPKKCLPDFPIIEDGWCEQIPEKRLEYKNQGPFPKSTCYNGPFNLYHYYTGTPKMYNNDELKLWQKSCEKLADCKHASKMTWDIVKGDTFDTYSCVPKTCLPDYPKKEKSGCEKDAENEQKNNKRTKSEKNTQSAAELKCTKSGGKYLGPDRNVRCNCKSLGIPGEIGDERSDTVGSTDYGECVCRYARGFDKKLNRCQFTQEQLNKCDTSISTPDKYKGCVCKNSYKAVWYSDDINTCETETKEDCEKIPGRKWDESGLCTCVDTKMITQNNKCENAQSKKTNAAPAQQQPETYKKQGPFPDGIGACHNGNFKLYKKYTGELKAANEAEFKEWLDGCKSLTKCKNALEMEGVIDKQSSDANVDYYNCVPKTCPPEHPKKETWGCTNGDNNDVKNEKEQKESSNKIIQGYIDKIKSIIAAGVKVGDEFDESDIGDLYALPNNAEYTKAYDELKAACKNATKPDNAKDLNWQPAIISPSKKPRCIIASCETNWYPSKNETECESEESVNAQRKERCEGKDATFNEEDGNCYCKGKLWAWDNDKIWNKNKKCKEKKSNDDNDEDDENETNDSASDKQFLSDVDKIIDAYKEKVKELTKKSK